MSDVEKFINLLFDSEIKCMKKILLDIDNHDISSVDLYMLCEIMKSRHSLDDFLGGKNEKV